MAPVPQRARALPDPGLDDPEGGLDSFMNGPALARFSNAWTHGATIATVALNAAQIAAYPERVPVPSVAIGGGLIYLFVVTVGFEWAIQRSNARARLTLLVVATALITVILWATDGYAWMAGLPLVSQAVLYGSLPFSMLIAAITTAETSYLAVHSGDADFWPVVASAMAANSFVIGFSVIARREARWRVRAELVGERLMRVNDELTAYADEVAKLTANRERTRIARELHDSLGHCLTGVHVQLEAAKALLAREDSHRAIRGVDRAQALAKRGIGDMRASVAALRSPEDRSESLNERVHELLENVDTGAPRFEFEATGAEVPLSAEKRHAIERAIQEGVTNVRRHANATRARVHLDYAESKLTVRVEDDGKGDRGGEGFGLVGMRERMEQVGGTMRHGPGPAGGFCLELGLELGLGVDAS